ncbi:centromere protein X-like [Penaeus japonicus]|uniref:centromere protein X-like n=1 Tax=Penaeus japonicus TaxID=27405 RepID=UPI001C71035C|nr:centromere protein X-like [Penaeus japonicus]XP_042880950.1 centromere protein X-like [Penaeus japonicus]
MQFSERLIEEFLKSNLDDKKVRISADAIKMVAEIARLIVIEGATRAAHQAKTEGADTVSLQHMEKILAQLLLDL